MSLANLNVLRAYIKNDAGLQAYWTAHYGKQPRHFIGYKRPVSANDFPAVCYVPVKALRGMQPFEDESVSLVLCIHEPAMADDVFDGMARFTYRTRSVWPKTMAWKRR